jgi:hypothetical protein
MPVELAEFRRIMVNDFGVACTGLPVAGGSVSFTAIFDSNHTLEDAGGYVAFSTNSPKLTCVSDDVTNLVEGDTVQVPVDSVVTDYTIVVSMPDGTGITEFMLEKQ